MQKMCLSISVICAIALSNCSPRNKDSTEPLFVGKDSIGKDSSLEYEDLVARPQISVNEEKCVFFIGYRNFLPVFRNCDPGKNRVLIYNGNENFLLLDEVDQDLTPTFINDKVVLYLKDGVGNGSKILIDYGNHVNEFEFSNKILFPMVGDDLSVIFYYDMKSDEMKARKLAENKDVAIAKSATPLKIDSNFLYCETPSSMGDGFVDIYRSSLSNLTELELVVPGLYGEFNFIFPQGTLIACAIPIDGEARHAVFNVEEKKFHVLEDQELNTGNYYSVYDFGRKSILYYRANSPKFMSKEVPRLYEFSRK